MCLWSEEEQKLMWTEKEYQVHIWNKLTSNMYDGDEIERINTTVVYLEALINENIFLKERVEKLEKIINNVDFE
ncbi:MAG: hypothetical protein ACXWVZ_04905 [Kaistella sp.]